MIIDLEKFPGTQAAGFDVCIVGAGAAGITLAVELLRYGKRVVLLEGGGLKHEAASQSLYDVDVTGMPYAGHQLGRFRVLGGSTTEWAGQILELDEHDFASRAWVPSSGWPIAKSELTSAYARAIELEGLHDSPHDAADIWNSDGIVPPDLGGKFEIAFSQWCPEPNFARLHGPVLKTHANLSLFVHASACEFMPDENDENLGGIRARTASGKELIVKAERYVLCAGGIENSRLLLQPRQGGTAPWHGNGMVGRHYTDHIEYHAPGITGGDAGKLQRFFGTKFQRGYKLHPKIKLALGQQEKQGTLNVGGSVEFSGADDDTFRRARQAAGLIRRGRLSELKYADLGELLRQAPFMLRNKMRRTINPGNALAQSGVTPHLVVLCEQSPLSESRITLSGEKDAIGLLRAQLNWKISAEEIATVRRYIQIVRETFSQYGLGTIEADPASVDDHQMTAGFKDFYHHMGGTRMAASAAQGVVDKDLKIFGTGNFYVCGSSVFPSSGFSNPTHTIIALAVRLAGHLNKISGAQEQVHSSGLESVREPHG